MLKEFLAKSIKAKKMKNCNYKKLFFITIILIAILSNIAYAADIPFPKLSLGVEETNNPQDIAFSIQILIILTVLTLAPAILVMMSPFTRLVIVLSFLRQAIGTQQAPPNQVLVGIALFMTFFIMAPSIEKINNDALQPFLAKKINQEVALEKAMVPLRDFMFRQTRQSDLALYIKMAKLKRPKSPKDVPSYVLIPAFVTSELKTAFLIGFIIYLPFLIIDMVVASVLMSMGMLMLPPTIISLPFKLILFVLVDGWHLISQALVTSFL